VKATWGLLVAGAILLGNPINALAYLDETRAETVLISPYKPTYLLLGSVNTKIELSFKGQLVEQVPLFFGYTQLMFWDLFKDSSPFSDINYNPEVFYRGIFFQDTRRWIDFGLFEHESNGKGGDDSRSWDRAYLRYSDQWKLGERFTLNASAKAWVPYATIDNSDIAKYRGLAEFTVSFSGFLGRFFERDDLIFRFYLGGATYINPLQGGQELTFRVKSAPRKFLPLTVIQLFHGYGENLLNYRDNRTALRAGIGF
jgi:outer membrane phospholipase A